MIRVNNVQDIACRLPLALLAVLCSASCVETSPELEVDRMLTGLVAPVHMSAAWNESADPDGFYLALHKGELGKPYFWSTYLRQLFPHVSPPAHVLDVKVVSFEVQNGRLHVFDVDTRKKNSNLFDPSVLVEAFPLVEREEVKRGFANADEYVIFDPAGGLNDFGVISSAFSTIPQEGGKLSTDLKFAERFLPMADGAQLDLTFAGHYDQPYAWNDGSVQQNRYLMHGTVAIAFRRYAEGAGFTPSSEANAPYYLSAPSATVPNAGEVFRRVARANVGLALPPVRWYIAGELDALRSDPRYAPYDLAGAIRSGVEAWNDAFGFRAVELVTDPPRTRSEPGDDGENCIIVDRSTRAGAAFADLRINPNNGEIRNATVYFSTYFVDVARALFAPATVSAAELASLAQVGSSNENARAWARHEVRLLNPSTLRGAEKSSSASLPAADAKQRVEGLVTHIILHEIGHTLGLRHNFAGSLEEPIGSVMDYIPEPAAWMYTSPLRYDREALAYLYGLSPQPPSGPFCTEEHLGASTPQCAPLDLGSDPLAQTHGARYLQLREEFLKGTGQNLADVEQALAAVLDFVRVGSYEERRRAFEIATQGLLPAVTNVSAAPAGWSAERADELLTRVWHQLAFMPHPAATYATPVSLSELLGARLYELLRAQALNSDGLRSVRSRQQALEVLKQVQTLEGLATLRELRDYLRAARAGSDLDALIAEELVAQADTLLTPYFERAARRE